MKKKIISLCLVIALLATAITGATLAYFVDNEAETNVFTVGNVDIELDEPQWEETGKSEAVDAYPGEALAKDPTVTNVGKNPCFVRVKVTGLDQFVDTYGPGAMITLRHGNYEPGYDDEYWTYKDGYYYYKEILTYEGDTYNAQYGYVTEPVFNQIVMPIQLQNNEEAEPIEVVAEAVQAQGARESWSKVKEMTVDDISLWFATVTATNQMPVPAATEATEAPEGVPEG